MPYQLLKTFFYLLGGLKIWMFIWSSVFTWFIHGIFCLYWYRLNGMNKDTGEKAIKKKQLNVLMDVSNVKDMAPKQT